MVNSRGRYNTARLALTVASIAFGFWQHSVFAGVFLGAYTLVIMVCVWEVVLTLKDKT